MMWWWPIRRSACSVTNAPTYVSAVAVAVAVAVAIAVSVSVTAAVSVLLLYFLLCFIALLPLLL